MTTCLDSANTHVSFPVAGWLTATWRPTWSGCAIPRPTSSPLFNRFSASLSAPNRVADDDMATDVERLRDSWADLIEQNDGWLDYRPAPSEGSQMQDVIAQVGPPCALRGPLAHAWCTCGCQLAVTGTGLLHMSLLAACRWRIAGCRRRMAGAHVAGCQLAVAGSPTPQPIERACQSPQVKAVQAARLTASRQGSLASSRVSRSAFGLQCPPLL